MKCKAVLLNCIVLALACSSEDNASIESVEMIDYELVIADTIGIEMGDSNYVFGTIIDGAYLPDGRIALLDVRKNRISVFSSEGEFILSFGDEGNGPGEFAEPVELAVLDDGKLVVCDYMHQKLLFFDSLMNFSDELAGFTPNPPHYIENGNGGSIVGIQSHYFVEGDIPYFGLRLGSWSNSIEPDLILTSAYTVPENGRIEIYFVEFCTDSRGMIYTASTSFDEYSITCYNPEGDTLFYLSEPYTRTEKTPEEIESEHMSYRYDTPGFDADDRRAITSRWEPYQYRQAVQNIYADALNRIWVMSGRKEEPSPLFEVYDSQGSHLCSVPTDFGPEANNWQFVFGDSTALAFDTNPSDYSKVIVLNIIEE
jgi:hypothetical protein